jgi:hypothetical protein
VPTPTPHNPRTTIFSVFRASSTLTNLALSHCTFNDVLLKSCTIRAGILHHYILFDCDIGNSVFKHCQFVKAPLALRRFAPEIRAIIFEHVIKDDCTFGKIPALVKSLRGDQVLYKEAVHALYKKGFVPLSFIDRMKPVNIQVVTKVSMNYK